MKLKKLIHISALYALIPLVERGVQFLLLPIYTRYIDPAAFGAWATVVAFFTVINIVASIKLDSAYIYTFKIEDGWKNPKELIQAASLKFSMVTLTIGYLVLGFAFYFYYPLGENLQWLWVLGFLDGWHRYFFVLIQRKFQIQLKRWVFFKYSIIKAIFYPALSFILIFYYRKGIYGLAIAEVFVGLIVLAPMFRHLWDDIKRPFSKPALKEAMYFSLPLFFFSISSWGLNLIDRIILQLYRSMSEVGLYDMGAKLASVVVLINIGLNQSYIPVFMEYFKKRKFSYISKIQSLYGSALAVISVMIWLMLPFIYRLFIDQAYADSITYSNILLLDAFFAGLQSLVMGYYLYLKQTKAIMYINIVALLLNVALNLYLVPNYGAYAAAWNTVVCRSLTVIAMFTYAYVKGFLRYELKGEG